MTLTSALLSAGLLIVATACATALLAARARLGSMEEQRQPRGPVATADAIAELATVRAEWAAFRKNLDAYLETFEDLAETVERKRRRAASSASRAEAAEQGNGEAKSINDLTRDELRNVARSRGFAV